MYKKFSGVCPLTKNNAVVGINYLLADGDFDNPKGKWVKNLVEHCNITKKCNTTCPIYESAPQNIEF